MLLASPSWATCQRAEVTAELRGELCERSDALEHLFREEGGLGGQSNDRSRDLLRVLNGIESNGASSANAYAVSVRKLIGPPYGLGPLLQADLRKNFEAQGQLIEHLAAIEAATSDMEIDGVVRAFLSEIIENPGARRDLRAILISRSLTETAIRDWCVATYAGGGALSNDTSFSETALKVDEVIHCGF